MFSVFAITGRALRGEIVQDRGRREIGATNGSRRVCTEITLNVPEPSALDRRSSAARGRWRAKRDEARPVIKHAVFD